MIHKIKLVNEMNRRAGNILFEIKYPICEKKHAVLALEL
jgi:hypothetical protein